MCSCLKEVHFHEFCSELQALWTVYGPLNSLCLSALNEKGCLLWVGPRAGP